MKDFLEKYGTHTARLLVETLIDQNQDASPLANEVKQMMLALETALVEEKEEMSQ